MFPVGLEITYTTESNTSASYLDLLLLKDRDGQLHNYSKCDDFGIPVGSNYAPLPGDRFLHSYEYETEFIQSLLSAGEKQLAPQFNFTYRYIDDLLSINNPDFDNYLGQMYPAELEIKDTTESNTSASYLDLLLSIGRGG